MQTSCPESLHRRFVELVADFYCDAGWDAPALESDPYTAVAFKAAVDEISMTVGYDPKAGESCVFVHCALGDAHHAADAGGLRRLLESNMALLRNTGAAYCIDAETGELACYARFSPNIELRALHSVMTELAGYARAWLNGEAVDEAGAGDRAAQISGRLEWARLV